LVGGRIGSSEDRRKKRNAGKKSWRSPAFLDESTATGVEGTSWGESAKDDVMSASVNALWFVWSIRCLSERAA
jgi:hypothetical protein